MADFDMHNSVITKSALAPTAISSATTTNGITIDTLDSGNNVFRSLEFSVQVTGFSAGNLAIKLQDGEQSNLSDAADVDAELMLGGAIALVSTDGAAQVARIGYIGKKRYVRVVVTSSNTPTANINVHAVLGMPADAPTAS